MGISVEQGSLLLAYQQVETFSHAIASIIESVINAVVFIQHMSNSLKTSLQKTYLFARLATFVSFASPVASLIITSNGRTIYRQIPINALRKN